MERLAGYRRGTGLAQAYGLVVLVGTVVLALLPAGTTHSVVRAASTNLHNLGHDPILVLVVSAFVVWPVWGLWMLPVLLVVYGAAQRWAGVAVTLVTAVFGHVGATLFVAALLHTGVEHGRLDAAVAESSDVGVSYGVVAVAGLLTARVPPRRRHWYVLGLVAWCLVPAIADPDSAQLGHLVAAGIGLALAVVVARAPHPPPTRRS